MPHSPSPARHTHPPAEIGALLLGGAGATAFVMVNRTSLPEPWPGIAAGLWAALACVAVVVVANVERTRSRPAPHRLALPIYGSSVTLMGVAIVLSARLLSVLDAQAAQPAVVAALVGAHFLPLAWAFREPGVAAMGGALVLLGGLGAALSHLAPWVGPGAGVVCGLVMLAATAADAQRRSRP